MTEFFSPHSGRRVAETQQAAYHAITVKELTAKQKMVVESFHLPGERLTREDIAARTNLKLSSVCGRVRELLDAGRLVVVGSRKDPATGASQQLLSLVIHG
ncbi:hypothetical protein BGV72_24430 [Burkholderia ubonensis]|uniref:hypothetical protein n=1 Tax=Burkholderia ubonensis TaxID=101571 RepID=UPI0008FE2F80|nr:hypothetical protein [Burkholderia ubonensis]OJA74535.1 hypothetical protein BGV72_24430 [Burkholderia ubonensis]